MNAGRISKRRATPRRIEALFALTDQIEAWSQAAQFCNRWITPFLDRAFKGQLVPQDLSTNRLRSCWREPQLESEVFYA